MTLFIDLNDDNVPKGTPRKSANSERQNLRSAISAKPARKRFTVKKVVIMILSIILLGLCSGAAYMGYNLYSTGREVGFRFSPSDLVNPIKKDPELKKDSSGKFTNVLIVGVDTRENNKGLQNTDTIMVLSYNYGSGDIVMFSIPRDTYVEVPDSNPKWYNKINGVYSAGEQKEEGSGLKTLQKSVEEFTGLEIQYYGMVDLKGFTSIIDAIGGIDVYVENSFTDYCYPTGYTSYNKSTASKDRCDGSGTHETVSFKKGLQTMDGETALKYARSRKSNDNSEGTDYARARRQQNVINAIKNKALSSTTLLDPSTIIGVLDSVKDNVKTSTFDSEDLQAAIKLAQKQQEEEGESYSFVFDPYIAGRKLIKANPNFSNQPVEGLGKYGKINQYVQLALKNPQLYEEDAVINVYDVGIGNKAASTAAKELQSKYEFLNIVYRGTLLSGKTGTYVYDNSQESSASATSKELTKSLDAIGSKPEFVTSRLNGEDVTVLLGADPAEPTDSGTSSN